MIHIGENIKRLRKERNITQEGLANFIGVSYQSVSKWERHESYPDITLLPSLASFLGVTTDELLGVIKHNNGDDEGALECFRKEAELAMKYEAMPDITTHTSYLVKGLEFNKAKAFKVGYDNIACEIKDALESGYPLSDEFRATEEFKKIVESIR